MKDKVFIAHLFSSEYDGGINCLYDEYLKKGYLINHQSKSAYNGKIIIYFLDTKMNRYKEKMRGMKFDDITGWYDDEDLMRISR